jgi:hypothetical protein
MNDRRTPLRLGKTEYWRVGPIRRLEFRVGMLA